MLTSNSLSPFLRRSSSCTDSFDRIKMDLRGWLVRRSIFTASAATLSPDGCATVVCPRYLTLYRTLEEALGVGEVDGEGEVGLCGAVGASSPSTKDSGRVGVVTAEDDGVAGASSVPPVADCERAGVAAREPARDGRALLPSPLTLPMSSFAASDAGSSKSGGATSSVLPLPPLLAQALRGCGPGGGGDRGPGDCAIVAMARLMA